MSVSGADPRGRREPGTFRADETQESSVGQKGSRPDRPPAPEEAVAEAELARAHGDLPAPVAWRALVAPSVPISCGAVLGANARYLVGLWATARWPGTFPWGTLLINVTGSLAIGIYLTLVTARFPGRVAMRLFVATGFLGAYTTFSTFSYETVTLVRQGMLGAAILYVASSLVLGLAAVVVGTLAAQAM